MNLFKRLTFRPEKKVFTAVLVLVLAIFVGMSCYSVPASQAKAKAPLMIPASFTDLAEMVSPSVVNIQTVKNQNRTQRQFRRSPFGQEDPFNDFFEKFFGGRPQREFKQRSLGTGFIIDKDGYIVTNNHVVQDTDQIKVILENDQEYDAEIIGLDPNTDLALIKIDPDGPLAALELGDSDDIKVGQWVMAIGNPFGLEHTVTTGIISAKGRVIGSGPYDDFIQTDASINPGNSGGPLVNLEGKVVGINTAIVAGGQGIGFAIPVDLAKGIIAQLRDHGEVTRGWLGVGIQPLNKELGKYYGIEDGKGALVTEVFPGDPAADAGIQPQDIILSINDQQVESSRDLTRIIAESRVGETVKVKVLRDGKVKNFRVKLAKRDDQRIASTGRSQQGQEGEFGIRVSDVTPELKRQFGIEENEGVIVVEVEPKSKGDKAGVRAGDRILEVNHAKIKSVRDYTQKISQIKSGESVYLYLLRMNRGHLVVKMEK